MTNNQDLVFVVTDKVGASRHMVFTAPREFMAYIVKEIRDYNTLDSEIVNACNELLQAVMNRWMKDGLQAVVNKGTDLDLFITIIIIDHETHTVEKVEPK